jgi:LPXTG-site transpeptidase (sortase) family protein
MSRAAAILAAVALTVAGCGSDASPPLPDRATAPVANATATASATPGKPRRERAKRVALPVRVQIPEIGVDAPLIKLGLDAHGALEVPKRFEEAGWWTGGSRPGERGPAVIAGHVDSKTGPAVFYRLGALRKGDAVWVRRRDGTRVRFTVQGSARFAKDDFPTDRVYGMTRRPSLRLITCGGTFDSLTGHYVDNTVVFASS